MGGLWEEARGPWVVGIEQPQEDGSKDSIWDPSIILFPTFCQIDGDKAFFFFIIANLAILQVIQLLIRMKVRMSYMDE